MNQTEHLHDKQYRQMALHLCRLMREPGLTWRDRIDICDTMMFIRLLRDDLMRETGQFGEAGAQRPSPPTRHPLAGVSAWL